MLSYAQPTIHASQENVAQRASKLKKASFVLTDDKGFGKTRTVGKIMEKNEDRRRNHEIRSAQPRYILHVFVTPTTATAMQQFNDLGLTNMSRLMLKHTEKPKWVSDLRAQRRVRTTMTYSMCRQLFFGTRAKEMQLGVLLERLPDHTTVVFVIDEVHSFVTRATTNHLLRIHHTIDRASKRHVQVAIHGVSATLDEAREASTEGLFGRPFQRMHMTDIEKQHFRVDVIRQPPAPTSFEAFPLPSPLDEPTTTNAVDALREALVVYAVVIHTLPAQHALFGPPDSNHSRIKRQRLIMARLKIAQCIDKIMCQLVVRTRALHGSDGVARQRIDTYRHQNGAFETEPMMRWPGVLISCSSSGLMSALHDELEAMAEAPDVQASNPFAYFDARAADKRVSYSQTEDDRERNVAAAMDAVRTQAINGPTLAMITQAQRIAINTFAKNFHVVVAVDERPHEEASLQQFLGRVGRAEAFEEGDLKPSAFLAYHIKCPWIVELRRMQAQTVKSDDVAIVDYLRSLDTHFGTAYESLREKYVNIVTGDAVDFLKKHFDTSYALQQRSQAIMRVEDGEEEDDDDDEEF